MLVSDLIRTNARHSRTKQTVKHREWPSALRHGNSTHCTPAAWSRTAAYLDSFYEMFKQPLHTECSKLGAANIYRPQASKASQAHHAVRLT